MQLRQKNKVSPNQKSEVNSDQKDVSSGREQGQILEHGKVLVMSGFGRDCEI